MLLGGGGVPTAQGGGQPWREMGPTTPWVWLERAGTTHSLVDIHTPYQGMHLGMEYGILLECCWPARLRAEPLAHLSNFEADRTWTPRVRSDDSDKKGREEEKKSGPGE